MTTQALMLKLSESASWTPAADDGSFEVEGGFFLLGLAEFPHD